MTKNTAAQLCKKNGWGPGTQLMLASGAMVEILSVGEIIVRAIDHHGKEGAYTSFENAVRIRKTMNPRSGF